ncbi:MAG: hypothetical protein ACPL25_11575 [Ignavibacteria bacterium]
MDIINNLTNHLKRGNVVENPEAYIRQVITNSITHREGNFKEIYKLISNLKEILNDLENREIIYSYNNRSFYYVLDNDVNSSRLTNEEIINRVYGYDFTEINKENQWNENKKNLIKKFIVDFLNDVKIIEFNTLIEVLKIKLHLKVNIVEPVEENSDEDNNDNLNSFENIFDEQTDQIEMYTIKEYVEKYKSSLKELMKKKNGEIIICSIYYRFYEEKSFQEIASLLNYSSPSTIQIQINNNFDNTPEGFVKIISFLDEDVRNPFIYAKNLENELLKVLKDVFEEIKARDNE